jgi:hypothetical protein
VATAAWIALCLLHGAAILAAMGGAEGLRSPWPLAKHDHPLYFHSARVTSAFLAQNGTTAGYDPTFMSGYAKSVVFPASSTLPELWLFAFGRGRPIEAYKLYVLVSASLAPWLVAAAGLAWGLSAPALAVGVLLWLVYVWTDFPIQYATFGMLPYFLAIPLGLLTTALLDRFLRRGGFGNWLAAALAATLVVLVHFTSAMVVAPAALIASGVDAIRNRRAGSRRSWRRIGAWWAIALVVLALNAFWWAPGIALASTKGESAFAFVHPEGVGVRLAKILTTEPTIQPVLIGLGVLGLAVLARRHAVLAAGLGGFALSGFLWGYAAGSTRSLDFLQPGRHTYAFYAALSLAAGAGLAAGLGRLRAARPRLAWAAGLGLLVLGVGTFGRPVLGAVAFSLGNPLPGLVRRLDPALGRSLALARPSPMLSSRPTARLRWTLDAVKAHVRPGERLFYEEGGFGVPGVPDPFDGGRYSGLLPYYVPGIELVGGPYLHAALTTNHAQIGEGRLFGREGWDRAWFDAHARLYRPSALLAWSPAARAFVRANPDRFRIVADEGTLLLARVQGFGGMTIEGRAEVDAAPGRLRVRPVPGEVDGWVVLRYHSVPTLRSRPVVPLEAVRLGPDPVPFIRLKPPPGGATLDLGVGAGW